MRPDDFFSSFLDFLFTCLPGEGCLIRRVCRWRILVLVWGSNGSCRCLRGRTGNTVGALVTEATVCCTWNNWGVKAWVSVGPVQRVGGRQCNTTHTHCCLWPLFLAMLEKNVSFLFLFHFFSVAFSFAFSATFSFTLLSCSSFFYFFRAGQRNRKTQKPCLGPDLAFVHLW